MCHLPDIGYVPALDLRQVSDDALKAEVRRRAGGFEPHPAPGNRVRELRVARSWTLQDLATATGTHFTILGRLELGDRQLTQRHMERIARALNVPPADLLPDPRP